MATAPSRQRPPRRRSDVRPFFRRTAHPFFLSPRSRFRPRVTPCMAPTEQPRSRSGLAHPPQQATQPQRPPLRRRRHRSRRYLAVAALLMVFASVAALASETVRNGLAQLRLQFFPDNVTIEAAPEPATEQAANGQTGPTATKEFHAYKWKEVPEGYEVVQEDEDVEFKIYQIDYKNSLGGFIHYVQGDAQTWQTSISYDTQKGYKHILQLDDGLEAYSISDGRNNTIFYEKDGYLFEFMSDQPEEIIIDYINMSGILDYEY